MFKIGERMRKNRTDEDSLGSGEVMIFRTRYRRGWVLISMGLLLAPYLTYLAKEPVASLPVVFRSAVNQKVDFSRDIQPIFTQTCYPCHGPAMQMSSFRLDQRESAMAGGNSGRVIKPGDSANSKLIQLVAGVLKDAVMPPEGERLSKEQVGLLRAWIDQGANWPEGSAASAAPATSVAKSNHWSFQPVKHPVLPQVRNASWVRNPIDRVRPPATRERTRHPLS